MKRYNRPIRFIAALLLALQSVSAMARAQTGPMVGAVKDDEARFLYRPGEVAKTLRLSVLDGKSVVGSDEVTTGPDSDFVAKFHITGLSADTTYQYRIDEIVAKRMVPVLGPRDGLSFRTTKPRGKRDVVTAAFMSCANATAEPVWQRMDLLGIDYLFLGGDTPYIDNKDLATIRSKHRAFLETPFFSKLIRKTPTVGTWDDHDFGANDADGLFSAKAQTRRAFVEYRAHDRFGTGREGVFHKADLGEMEVFLLDPRWWSQTGPSPVDPEQATCFGLEQLQWIRDSLLASKARFKVLLMGQIWQDKKNGEKDDMFTYWYERDALFDFIRTQRIPGVVLVGGDIHVSRYLVHPQRVGYDLHDFITSPAHRGTIPSLDVFHPDLEWSSTSPNQFLTLSADTRCDPPALTARFYLADGTVQKEIVLPYSDLTPRHGEGLGHSLRAWWDFEKDFTNKAVLGKRADANPVNGATRVENGGLRGGAIKFDRDKQQYLLVPRSVLDDNSANHTVSIWCRPGILPYIATPDRCGGEDRCFLMESIARNEVSSARAYTISIGFRAARDPDRINLQIHTRTIKPAAKRKAPAPQEQGPFNCMLERALFNSRWVHVVMTFDSQRIKLYVDGKEVADHALPFPGPAAEFGGLIIGGHREGTGRNFDGMMDEIALWQRVLNHSEIVDLYHSGSPEPLPTGLVSSGTGGRMLSPSSGRMDGSAPGLHRPIQTGGRWATSPPISMKSESEAGQVLNLAGSNPPTH